MFKYREKLLRIIYGLFDVAVVGVSFVAAYHIRKNITIDFFPPFEEFSYFWLLCLILLSYWQLLSINKVNNISYRGKSIRILLLGIIKTNIQGLLLIGFIIYFFKYDWISRSLILIFFIISSFLLIIEKIALFRILRKIRTLDRNIKYTLIIGTGDRTKKLISMIKANVDSGFRIIGVLSDNFAQLGNKIDDISIIGDYNNVSDILHREIVDDVFITLSMKHIDHIKKIVIECEHLGVNTHIMTQIVEPSVSIVYTDTMFGISFITFTTRDKKLSQQYAKLVMDYTLATILVILLIPLIIIIAAMIKLDSEGPIFYKQVRAGMRGRKFTIYKFRSMFKDAEKLRFNLEHLNEADGPVFKISKDQRITRFGKLLRKTSLDEIPQLLNVLKGEMSLVGPRPLFIYESDKITGAYRRRLSMKPGITGLWQVHGRSDVNFDDWMTLDLKYIDNWSLWLDLQILFKTLFVPLTTKGAY